MADFKISQLPVASDAAEGDFMIINKGNTTTNRIDVKEFIDDFVDGNYLSLSSGTFNQTVASTGKVTISGTTGVLGKLGVGTNNPVTLVDIRASNQFALDLRREGDSPSLCRLQNSGNYFNINNNGNGICFYTGLGDDNVTQRVTITNSGKVGIGTVDPTALLHLNEISPEIKISNADPIDGSNQIISKLNIEGQKGSNYKPAASIVFRQFGTWSTGDNFQSPTGIQFCTQNNDPDNDLSETAKVTINHVGAIGIGKSAPVNVIDVLYSMPEVNISNSSGMDASGGDKVLFKLKVEGQKGSNYKPAASIIFRQDNKTWSTGDNFQAPTRIEFCTQNTATNSDVSQSPTVVINSDRNVGVGSMFPKAKLEVSRLGNVAWNGPDPTAGTTAHFFHGNESPTSPSYLAISSGNQSSSGLYFGDTDDVSVGWMRYDHVTDSITLAASRSEIVTFDSNGTTTTAIKVNSRILIQDELLGISPGGDSGFDRPGFSYYSNGPCSIGRSALPVFQLVRYESAGAMAYFWQGFGNANADGSYSKALNAGNIASTGTADDVGIKLTSNGTTGPVIVQNSDARVKSLIPFTSNASDIVKLLNPGVNGFIAHELQSHVSEAVTGTQNEEEPVGTLIDYDGTVLETEVIEPYDLTYTEEVEVSPFVAATSATYDDEGNEISAATAEVEAVTQTVTRTRVWNATGTRPVYQGIDQSKLIPLLTKSLQEALARIEALEAQIGS